MYNHRINAMKRNLTIIASGIATCSVAMQNWNKECPHYLIKLTNVRLITEPHIAETTYIILKSRYSIKKEEKGGVVTHTCNPSIFRGQGRRIN